MSAMDAEPFPRGALIAAAALLGLSIVATAAVRLVRITAPSPVAAPRAAPVASVDLAFADQTDGSVSVRDSHTGALVATLSPGTNGFVRGVLRGLAHDRMTRHIGAAPPFRLTELDRGRLFLRDTATGREIDLQSFGVDNRDAFKRFLHPEGASS